jgi:hypothetical protein
LFWWRRWGRRYSSKPRRNNNALPRLASAPHAAAAAARPQQRTPRRQRPTQHPAARTARCFAGSERAAHATDRSSLHGLGASSLSTLRLRRGGGWASGTAASHASEKEERGAVSTILPGYITAT